MEWVEANITETLTAKRFEATTGLGNQLIRQGKFVGVKDALPAFLWFYQMAVFFFASEYKLSVGAGGFFLRLKNLVGVVAQCHISRITAHLRLRIVGDGFC